MEIYVARIDTSAKKIRINKIFADEKGEGLVYRDGDIVRTIGKDTVGHFYGHEGFGLTPFEALAALKEGMDNKIERMQRKINYLQKCIDFEIVEDYRNQEQKGGKSLG